MYSPTSAVVGQSKIPAMRNSKLQPCLASCCASSTITCASFLLQPHPGVFGSCSVAPSNTKTWWPQAQYSVLSSSLYFPTSQGGFACIIPLPFCPPNIIVIGHLTMPARFQHFPATEVNKAGFVILKPLQELPAAFVSEYNALKMYIPFTSLLRFSQREITCWFFGGSAAVPFDSCRTSFWISAKALFILLTLSAFAMFICREKKNSTHWCSKLKLHWHHFCTTVN